MRAERTAAALALLLAAAPLARADYRDSYRRGIEAVEKGRWAEAATHLRAAAAEQPKEGERVKLYGMRFEEYLPHFQLGQALFQAGDCEGALRAFSVSQAQGVVQKSQAFRTLERSRGECQKRAAAQRQAPPTPAPAVAAAQKAGLADLARAEESARAVAALESDPALSPVWKREEALAGAQARAAALAEIARQKLKGGGAVDPADVAAGREAAQKAAEVYEGVRTAAATFRQAAAHPAVAPPSASPTVAPPAAAAAQRVPADLLRVAEAYFAGRYRDVLAATAAVEPDDGAVGTQLLLFRSAARYGLYVTGGQGDDLLRRQAQIDATACRRQAPALVPDPEAFSPRFREFFSRAR
jgi:tetratricopeptide (TPR) repeat protein